MNNAKPIPAGKDNEGDELFIGTDKEWENKEREELEQANLNGFYDENAAQEENNSLERPEIYGV